MKLLLRDKITGFKNFNLNNIPFSEEKTFTNKHVMFLWNRTEQIKKIIKNETIVKNNFI